MKSPHLFLIASMSMAGAVLAQDAYIISQQRFVKIAPAYQRWSVEGDNQFSEFSSPIQIYFPFSRNWSVTVLGNQASAKGEALLGSSATNRGQALPKLSGLTDTQLAVRYFLESMNLALDLGLNLPSGKSELGPDEFRTSAELSANIFNFQVPNFGQGFNISPGLTWAVPVRDNLVLGLGASYQYKGSFKPVAGLSDDYNPGDEVLFTGGLDLRLNETTTLSSDLIFTLYGTDQVGDAEIFAAGNKLVANAQFRKYFDFNELWLFARYRSSAKNDLAAGGQLVTEGEKTTPDQIELLGHYQARFTRRFSMRFLAEGRVYQDTPVFDGVKLFGGGLAPIFSASSNFQLLGQFKYLTGSFDRGDKLSGLEIGVGMLAKF